MEVTELVLVVQTYPYCDRKHFRAKAAACFTNFLLEIIFFPLSWREMFQTSNNTENQFWKANMGIGPTLAGNQVEELTPETGPVSLLVVKGLLQFVTEH